MRLLAILAGALALVPRALSVDIEKSILVTYNREAPRLAQLIDDAKSTVLEAGGRITHEFKIIAGFHAIVPEDVVSKIQEAGGDYITVEEDKTMSINTGL